ncbi:kelch repeat-containing protein [Paenibacillus hemerocallicola]|uniref:kelch repeat-containing protein n=1 Tax=Paenibacillus hemerocallicola TaxID=1172614 RepID=UPI003CCC686C
MLRNINKYNPATNTWTPLGNMPTPRVAFGAAKLNEKIYSVVKRGLELLQKI